MPILTFVAVYFIIWWVVLFAVLPFGVQSQSEANTRIEGTDPGAPVKPRLRIKFVITSVIALILWAVFYWLYQTDRLGLR